MDTRVSNQYHSLYKNQLDRSKFSLVGICSHLLSFALTLWPQGKMTWLCPPSLCDAKADFSIEDTITLPLKDGTHKLCKLCLLMSEPCHSHNLCGWVKTFRTKCSMDKMGALSLFVIIILFLYIVYTTISILIIVHCLHKIFSKRCLEKNYEPQYLSSVSSYLQYLFQVLKVLWQWFTLLANCVGRPGHLKFSGPREDLLPSCLRKLQSLFAVIVTSKKSPPLPKSFLFLYLLCYTSDMKKVVPWLCRDAIELFLLLLTIPLPPQDLIVIKTQHQA